VYFIKFTVLNAIFGERIVASIEYVEVRRGMVIVGEDGQLYQCLDRDLNTPGNWRAQLKLKLRNLKTGAITENKVRPQDKVELAFLDKREFQYSYKDGTDFVFMDNETFEQISLPDELIGEQMKYLKENDIVTITMYEGKPIDIELPPTVELKVIETEPALKGATAAAQYKPATLETGLKITVPPFINVGEVVQVDTRSGEYLGRAKS
jgi:elongation factor P